MIIQIFRLSYQHNKGNLWKSPHIIQIAMLCLMEFWLDKLVSSILSKKSIETERMFFNLHLIIIRKRSRTSQGLDEKFQTIFKTIFQTGNNVSIVFCWEIYNKGINIFPANFSSQKKNKSNGNIKRGFSRNISNKFHFKRTLFWYIKRKKVFQMISPEKDRKNKSV